MELKKLYRQTSTGAIQEWQVKAIGNEVMTKFGQLNSEKIQGTKELVKGKNVGKKNETTDNQQAEIKAKQLYDAKIKKGYTPDLELAQSTNNTLDAVNPMLAFPIEKKEKHVVFPALAQPKLDGMRCIAMVENGKCTLYTRTQKVINTLPHIVAQIEAACLKLDKDDLILDGELYNHEHKEDFNRLMSLIKRDEVHEDCNEIQYHLYDAVMDEDYWTRSIAIAPIADNCEHVFRVKTSEVEDREHLEYYFHQFLKEGYEGAMYRNPNIGYENKRSASLLKVKVMDDAEFTIIGVNEGKGKLAGHAGAFLCKIQTPDCVGTEFKVFKAKLKGKLGDLKEYFENDADYIGLKLTVQYQGLTPDGIPRFPVGLRIRIEE